MGHRANPGPHHGAAGDRACVSRTDDPGSVLLVSSGDVAAGLGSMPLYGYAVELLCGQADTAVAV